MSMVCFWPISAIRQRQLWVGCCQLQEAVIDHKRPSGVYETRGDSDHQKSELLKDILAMVNAYRAEPGYILIGFR